MEIPRCCQGACWSKRWSNAGFTSRPRPPPFPPCMHSYPSNLHSPWTTGILLAVGALDAAGLLQRLAVALSAAVPNVGVVAGAIGLVSALVDNVPLVAATMGMYDISRVPADSQLWQMIALCAGTGGSLLVIGSAAGVAFMGVESAGFGWYARRITPAAACGYAAALGTYILSHGLPSVGSSAL